MSRQLPQIPNLEFLKKKAKRLLRKLQDGNSGAKLTEAQHLIARQYGFASWNRLRKHLESLPVQPAPEPAGSGGSSGNLSTGTASAGNGGGLFPRFTMRGRRVIFFARYWAGKYRSDQIEPEHLLLGLMEEDKNLGRRFLGESDAPEKIREEIERRAAVHAESPGGHPVPLSLASRRALELAASEADRMGSRDVGIGHFLLAMLRAEEPVATPLLTEILQRNGVALGHARTAVSRMMEEEPQ